MDYISFLTEEEIEILCNVISGEVFKTLFKKKPKDFAKIKPGFRSTSIPEKEAISLGIKHIKKPFIFSFVNGSVQEWLREIDELNNKLLEEGINEDVALAKTLSSSPFVNHFELYFKLINRDVDEAYLARLHEYISISDEMNIEDEKEFDTNNEISTTLDEADASNVQMGMSMEKVNEHESQSQDFSEVRVTLEQNLMKERERVQELERENKEMRTELINLRERVQYDDSVQIEAAISAVLDDSDYDYLSLCEVMPVNSNGEIKLNRLADINSNGQLEAFCINEDIPKCFGNRSKLFFKDGPKETGFVGVWGWSAVPKNNDPFRDYVTTAFNPDIRPIEIIVIQGCKTAKELLEKLKVGLNIELPACRTVFAACLTEEQMAGFLCQSGDLGQNGNQIKLKEKVFTLPQYDINYKNIIRLSNGKTYFKLISIGTPSVVACVKDSMDIVKSVIFDRNTWQTFKQQGKTRSDWRNVRNFLESINSNTIVNDIADASNCSICDAQKMLDNFIAHAESYIDGTTLEDEIISAVVVANTELMERCKILIKDDWVTENQTSVDKAKSDLAGLQQEIKQGREQWDKERRESEERIAEQKANADEELAAVRREYDTLQSVIRNLNADISEREQFAVDVEKAVEQRILQAQSNAADFVAGLAFAPRSTVIASGNITSLQDYGVMAPKDQALCYESGVELNPDDLETINTWKEALELISFELTEAGVMSNLSQRLAAYMYSAYINKCPLIMAGPNAGAIVDAFSGAVFGRKAGVLECVENYSNQSVKACYSSEDRVVKIVNPFNINWIDRIPEIVSNDDKFFVAIHPYSEDLQIEPRSLYSYMTPIFTELFVEKIPTGNLLGGCITEDYVDFISVTTSRSYEKLLTKMHASLLVRTKFQTLLSNMHAMLNDENPDYDVIFTLLPYAYATMQTPSILEAIRGGQENRISISSNLLAVINGLYGDN